MSGDDSEMPHEEAVGMLDALRDGELTPEEAARVEAHVAGCARCKAVEDALGGGIRSAMTGGAAESEADLLPGVQKRLRLRSRGRFYGETPAKRAPSPWPLVLASLAVLAALVISYVLIGQMGSSVAPVVAPSSSSPASSILKP